MWGGVGWGGRETPLRKWGVWGGAGAPPRNLYVYVFLVPITYYSLRDIICYIKNCLAGVVWRPVRRTREDAELCEAPLHRRGCKGRPVQGCAGQFLDRQAS